MESIAVLMSTYNGEKYLSSQIDSILNQVFDHNKYKLYLYIRDDQSMDSTKLVISQYIKKFPEIIFQVDKGSKNIGVKKSFIRLSQIVDADYYFFSDQDDVWLPNKINEMVSVLSKFKYKPAGVYSDLWIADGEAKSTNILMKHNTRNARRVVNNQYKVDYRQLFFTYLVTGASFAFNNNFKMKYINNMCLEKIEQVRMHDSFLALLLALEDGLYFVDQPLVLYRQHNNNLVGAVASKKKNIWHYLLNLKGPVNNRLRLLSDAKLAVQMTSLNKENRVIEFFNAFEHKNYFKRWKTINAFEKFLTVSPVWVEKILYTFFVVMR